jgi:hypothetical protein
VSARTIRPLAAGYVIDVTGNGYLPFLMHPETPFEQDKVASPAAGALPAGYKNR